MIIAHVMIDLYHFCRVYAVGVNVFSASNPINISLGDNSSFRATVEVEARRDGQFSGTGDLQFQLSLRNTQEGAVFFTQQNVTVTILDADGKVAVHALHQGYMYM